MFKRMQTLVVIILHFSRAYLFDKQIDSKQKKHEKQESLFWNLSTLELVSRLKLVCCVFFLFSKFYDYRDLLQPVNKVATNIWKSTGTLKIARRTTGAKGSYPSQ
jgi:hypothetical protein